MQFKDNDIISMNQLDRKDIERVFKIADKIKVVVESGESLSTNKNVAILFYQPSTRTRLGFEAASLKLGAKPFGFSDPKVTRGGDFYKESLLDIVRVVDKLADVIVIRHPENHAAQIVADHTKASVINAGDGNNHHPTQALQDLYTIYKEHNGLDNLIIALVGDFKIRSFRSIIEGLVQFKIKKLYLIPSPNEDITKDVTQTLELANFDWEIRDSIEEIIPEVDVLELNGINHPYRSLDYQTPDTHKVTLDNLKLAKSNLSILHTMPRKDELPIEIDQTSYNKYFTQVEYGMYVKMALITLVLGNESMLD
ncbi:aspartate carbamoyltransferase [Oceanobacillus oncorhynchi]|uniref:aspartate/ornithine carbamoyltransferase family protein n=1 Tax=Oceanobacillus oncorhynchi TaxID=545501 RepID=UPI001867F568|nr:hypothetical protein [Oceanobacillus oncorhynchi]